MNSEKCVIPVTCKNKDNQCVSNWTELRCLEKGGEVPGGSSILNGMQESDKQKTITALVTVNPSQKLKVQLEK